MLAEKNQYIDSAYKQLQVISQDKQKRLEYEAREKAIRDYNQMMFESKENGREEGIKEEKYNTVKNLITFGMSSDNISQITCLSLNEIEKIRKEIRISKAKI